MRLKWKLTAAAGSLSVATLLGACATESQRVIETPAPVVAAYSGPKASVAIGQFANSSPFMRGIFTEGQNRLGNQARTILKTHLSRSGRFDVMERTNSEALAKESRLANRTPNQDAAAYLVTGDVTEFGRKAVGDKQLFGILGRGKQQIAYSKVSLNVVDVATSRIVYSAQGAGEYALSQREILGTGGTASYDATLNGKVLDLSIRQAVANLVAGMKSGGW